MSALLITHQVQIHFKGPQQHVQQFEIALSSTGGKEEKKKKREEKTTRKTLHLHAMEQNLYFHYLPGLAFVASHLLKK